MSTAELKEKLIAKIAVTDDDELLEHISDLIAFEHNGIHKMSPEEIEAVNEGLEQLKNDQWITHEESNKRAEEWLKKYGGQ
jgi:hypothetical protein